jgi:carboxyl-terminal processing protease
VVELERGDIPIETVLGLERLPEGHWNYWLDKQHALAYVQLQAFHATTSEELYRVLIALRQQGLKGLVLDLRGNPGGKLETAIEIAELFLPKDSLIVTVQGRRRALEVYRAGRVRESLWRERNIEPGIFSDLPLVVLIDGQSASASEILASALQDNHRAQLVGQRTFGKASVQTILPLPPNNHALKLTTAQYLRPSGQNIHRFAHAQETDTWGVMPDVLLPLSSEQQQELLASRSFRNILWQPQRAQQMRERFNVSTAALGSFACLIDPDNALYLRMHLITLQSDTPLDLAREALVKLIKSQ